MYRVLIVTICTEQDDLRWRAKDEKTKSAARVWLSESEERRKKRLGEGKVGTLFFDVATCFSKTSVWPRGLGNFREMYDVPGTHGTIGLEAVKAHVKSVMLKTWDSLEDKGKSLHPASFFDSQVITHILMLDSALRGLTHCVVCKPHLLTVCNVNQIHAHMTTKGNKAILKGVPVISVMSFSFVQLGCLVAVTQEGNRVAHVFSNRLAQQPDSDRIGNQAKQTTKKINELKQQWLLEQASVFQTRWRGAKNAVANLVLTHLLTQNNSSSPAKTIAHSGPSGAAAVDDRASMPAQTEAGEGGESGGGSNSRMEKGKSGSKHNKLEKESVSQGGGGRGETGGGGSSKKGAATSYSKNSAVEKETVAKASIRKGNQAEEDSAEDSESELRCNNPNTPSYSCW